jgi:hypothetical protein
MVVKSLSNEKWRKYNAQFPGTDLLKHLMHAFTQKHALVLCAICLKNTVLSVTHVHVPDDPCGVAAERHVN